MPQQTLAWGVGAPALIALITVGVAILLRRFTSEGGTASSIRAAIVAAGWSLAMAVALAAREFPGWWPEDAWQQVGWPVAATTLALALLAPRGRCVSVKNAGDTDDVGDTNGELPGAARCGDLWWLAAFVGSLATAAIAMPIGEGWVELYPTYRMWMLAVAGSALLNLWSLDGMVRRGAHRWVLCVALAGLGGPMMLAASVYAGLAEWVLGAIVATGVMALVALLAGRTEIWAAMYGPPLLAAATVATARFYTFEEHPRWMYGLALLTPTIIAAVDALVPRRRTFLRFSIALIVAVALLAAIEMQLGLVLGAEEAEAW